MILAVVCGGCVASHQSIVEDTDSRGWWETKSFTVENIDTVTLRDVELFVRYQPQRVDSVLRFAVDVTTPESISIREHVAIYPEIGGRGRIGVQIALCPYRENVVWDKIGYYSINITPASKLIGVEAVGINIVKSEK